MWMAQNNAVPEACDCAKKWVSIGLNAIYAINIIECQFLGAVRSNYYTDMEVSKLVLKNKHSAQRLYTKLQHILDALFK